MLGQNDWNMWIVINDLSAALFKQLDQDERRAFSYVIYVLLISNAKYQHGSTVYSPAQLAIQCCTSTIRPESRGRCDDD